MVFAYHVDQLHSQWHIDFDPAGPCPRIPWLIYVDNKTHEILRVTLEAEGIPADFPVRLAETTLDYNYQDISGHTFLLPYTSRIVMSAEGYLTRNDDEFRIYRKYQVESELKFDDATPPPLPEDQVKEQPAAPPAKKK
jgi:hypothetical protein